MKKLGISYVIILIVASLFLGEVGNFYERYGWWDLVLHFSSSLAVGIASFTLISSLIKGIELKLLFLISFSIAIMLGTMWELLEFTLDQLFEMNTQKSGIVDTMTDVIANVFGVLSGITIINFMNKRKNKNV